MKRKREQNQRVRTDIQWGRMCSSPCDFYFIFVYWS